MESDLSSTCPQLERGGGERERDRDRQTDRQRERDRDRGTETERQRETDRQRQRHRYRQTNRHRERERERERETSLYSDYNEKGESLADAQWLHQVNNVTHTNLLKSISPWLFSCMLDLLMHCFVLTFMCVFLR